MEQWSGVLHQWVGRWHTKERSLYYITETWKCRNERRTSSWSNQLYIHITCCLLCLQPFPSVRCSRVSIPFSRLGSSLPPSLSYVPSLPLAPLLAASAAVAGVMLCLWPNHLLVITLPAWWRPAGLPHRTTEGEWSQCCRIIHLLDKLSISWFIHERAAQS